MGDLVKNVKHDGTNVIVTFRDNSVVKYVNVGSSVINEMTSSIDMSTYFYNNIIGKYEAIQVEKPYDLILS